MFHVSTSRPTMRPNACPHCIHHHDNSSRTTALLSCRIAAEPTPLPYPLALHAFVYKDKATTVKLPRALLPSVLGEAAFQAATTTASIRWKNLEVA
jgi:hypothetical protein